VPNDSCLHAELDLGPFKLDEQIGCFAFGTGITIVSSVFCKRFVVILIDRLFDVCAIGTNCPDTACDKFTDCESCNALANCGFCSNAMGQGQCKQGTQNGPVGGSCPSGTKWVGKSVIYTHRFCAVIVSLWSTTNSDLCVLI
jgi:hypothetical protein